MVESSYTIGVKKGVKQGIEQGEKRKAIEIAKKLIDVLDTKTIAAKTGLSEQDIETLRQ
jgi:hypothetical protein